MALQCLFVKVVMHGTMLVISYSNDITWYAGWNDFTSLGVWNKSVILSSFTFWFINLNVPSVVLTCFLYYTAQGKVLNDFYESTAGKTWYGFFAVFCFAVITYIFLLGSLIHSQHILSSVQKIFMECYISLWPLNMFVQENSKPRLEKLGQLKLWQEERIG